MQFHILKVVNQLVLAQHAEPEISFDLIHMWRETGPFARGIVFVLGVMSAYSIGIMFERLVVLSRAKKASHDYAQALRLLLPSTQFNEAIALSKTLNRGYLSKVLGRAIEEYHRGVNTADNSPIPALRSFDVIAAVNRSLERNTLRVVNDLRRGLGGLATIGSSAPFVGLLGTVAGIINTFRIMAATGSGGLASASAGIAEALVTTAFGLLVAIPAVMVFNYLTNRVEDIQVDITDASSELVDYFEKQGLHLKQ